MFERFPAWAVRSLVAASIIASAAIFFVIVSRPMQSGPGPTEKNATPSGAGAKPTATTPRLAAEVTVTTTPGNKVSTKPAEGQFSPPATVNPQLPLLGRRVGLDPGHGLLDDQGAVFTQRTTSDSTLSEAEFNLDVAFRARDILVSRGASVVLTRESADTFKIPWPSDVNGDGIVGASGDELQQRVDILNNFKAEVFLSIHANGGSSDAPLGEDLQVLYCGTSDCGFPDESKRLGQLVLQQLQTKLTGATNMQFGSQLLTDVSTDSSDPPQHIFILGPVNPPRHVRATAMPGVLAESLFVTLPDQAALLNQSSVRQTIALAYADALQAYLTGASSMGK